MCLPLYGHHAISLTGFYNGRCKAVDRPCGDRAVIVLSPQPCIEIAGILHGSLAASIEGRAVIV